MAAQNNLSCMINTRWGDGGDGGDGWSGGDEEDAATVIAILTALAAAAGEPETEPATRSVWGDPAHRLGVAGPSRNGWWASGLPRGLPR